MISSAFGSESLNVAEIMVKIRNETVAGSIQEAMQRLSKSKTLKKVCLVYISIQLLACANRHYDGTVLAI